LFKFGEVEETAVGRFDAVDASGGSDTHGIAPVERNLPKLERALVVAGIEVDPLTVAGPVGCTIVDAGKSGNEARSAARNFDDVDLVVGTIDGLEGEIAAIGRPASGGRVTEERNESRAVGAIRVTGPDVHATFAVGLEGDLGAVRGVAGFPDDSATGE
jgi:hypothetical protein